MHAGPRFSGDSGRFLVFGRRVVRDDIPEFVGPYGFCRLGGRVEAAWNSNIDDFWGLILQQTLSQHF